MQTHKSWMRKETKSKYDKTKPCKPMNESWMTKKETKSKYDKTKHANP